MIVLKSSNPEFPDRELLEYTKVEPLANYSPWNKDLDFWKTIMQIQNHTLVDVFRCYELWHLVEQSKKLNSGAIIEVGVWRGGTGALIAKKAKLANIPNKVYLCDTFTGIVKASEKDSKYIGGEHNDTSQEIVENLIFKKMQLNNVEILTGIFPDETANKIQEDTFRLCHIDVDVYQSAHDIIEWIWSKMCVGGIIVYDDFGFKGCEGITKHVEEQMHLKDRIVLHNLNGHAIIIKIN
ncbi:TylF/MycF family methyltransferase [Thiotrichales bacterium 19S11-10]|nr:TylF/MycF family methyltransferase [Thiotrichales bacterium 19S11-10]MCF6807309.1 TylF/MycF family methyltransferase [Thiotrichales bacterium 19S9-11]MCF6811278.1 TylF/MycF family methyltransferase [Thiotrichales bacterium 19S9-12]